MLGPVLANAMGVASSDETTVSGTVDPEGGEKAIGGQWIEAGFTVTVTNDIIDVTDGGGYLSNGDFMEVGDISSFTLPGSSTTNHVWIIDRPTKGLVIGADTDGTPPSDPHLKIATVDTSASPSSVTAVNNGVALASTGSAEVKRNASGAVQFTSATSSISTSTTSTGTTVSTSTSVVDADANYTQVVLKVGGTTTTAKATASLNGSSVKTVTTTGTTTVSTTQSLTGTNTWTVKAKLTAGTKVSATLTPSINQLTTINAR